MSARTRLALLLAAASIAACGAPADVPPDALPTPLSLDVKVTPRDVVLYPNGTVPGVCDDELAHFAEPGACVDWDDAIVCTSTPTSCLSVDVTGSGVQPHTYDPTLAGPMYVRLPDVFPPDLVLRVAGCGHPEVAIPLAPFTAPTPTVTADVTDNVLGARWQTDSPAASTYVSFGFDFAGRDCHTTASELTYGAAPATLPGHTSVAVTTFLPVQTITSPQREIRIWRGNLGYTQL